MTNSNTWHYGLVAQLWAKFLLDTPELDYLKRQIAHFGQPVLDLACGTGRLLVPLLESGVDIDGNDISEDMLALCRKWAERQDLPVQLYQQPMEAFELSRRYNLIYICGSFGLGGSHQGDLETLRRCYRHLHPGGALILNIQAEFTFADFFKQMTKEYRDSMPEPWPEEGRRYVDDDGSVYISRTRLLALDPLEQSLLREIQIEKWLGDELLAREERPLTGRYFFSNELEWMLRLAGFSEIVVHGDWEEQEATAEHTELVFVATR
jgi:SAM-dependent methyltransferase